MAILLSTAKNAKQENKPGRHLPLGGVYMNRDERINDAIRQAKATLAIEGMHMSREDEELIRAKLRGEINRFQFIKRALKMVEWGMWEVGYSLQQIKQNYGLEYIKRGMKVRVPDGRMGRITAAHGSHLYVRLDENNKRLILHPTWEIVYYDEDGHIIEDFREKPRKDMWDKMTVAMKQMLARR